MILFQILNPYFINDLVPFYVHRKKESIPKLGINELKFKVK